MPPPSTLPTGLEEGLLARLETGLVINRDLLDQELIDQPQHFLLAAEECVLAISKRDAVKEQAKQLDAELLLSFREDLESKGKKPTEATLSALIEGHPVRKKLRTDLLEASRDVDILEAVKEAYSQRSWMLRELCSLYVAGFFSVTSVKGKDQSNVLEKANQDRRKKIRAHTT